LPPAIPASLEAALDALRADRPAEALPALLTAWRERRDPVLGDAIEEVGGRLETAAPTGRTRKDVLAAWAAQVTEPAARSTLLRTLLDGNSKEALARLQALVALDPDPRIGRALARAFANPPFQAGSTKPFWKLAATAAVTHGDATVAASLAALPGHLQARLGGVEMGAVLEAFAARAAAALTSAGHPALDPAARSALEQALAVGRPNPRALAVAAIDRVDWTTLEDAYGPADTVGAMLHALAGDDEALRAKAFAQAFGNIYHQGSVFSATVPAARVLVQLLAAPDYPDHAALLWLLVHLATSDPRDRCLGDPPPFAGATETEEPELAAVVGTWNAVVAAAPAACVLLDDPDPMVRQRAAFLLAFLTPDADTERALAVRVTTESDPHVLQSLHVSRALLVRSAGHRQNPPPPLGDAAVDAIVAALHLGPDADAHTLAALREVATTGSKRDPTTFPWYDGDLRTWARRLEQALGLRPTAELLAELDATDPTDRRAWEDRRAFLLRRLFGLPHAPGPKRVPASLDEDQRHLVRRLVEVAGDAYQQWPDLDAWRLFRTTRSMRRWSGLDSAGPLDHVVDGLPAWKHLTDRVYGHRPPEDLAAVLVKVPVEVRLGWWDEVFGAQGHSPYELELAGPHADEEPLYTLDLGNRHNDRFADLLATVACSCGEAGTARAEALLEAQRTLLDRGRYASGTWCATGLTVLVRARGAPLDARWDALVEVLARTPPVQRTPRRTAEVLSALPFDRAEALLTAAVEVAKFAKTSWTFEGQTRSWRTIRCDWGALDWFRLLPRASEVHAQRVVEAVVEWHVVRDQIPRGEAKPEPLPLDAIVDWLRWAGDAARPAIEAARGGPADAIWARCPSPDP
jgi:hypothetical protein